MFPLPILEAFEETEGQGLDEINCQLRNVRVDRETNILLETLEDIHYFLRDTREVKFFFPIILLNLLLPYQYSYTNNQYLFSIHLNYFQGNY